MQDKTEQRPQDDRTAALAATHVVAFGDGVVGPGAMVGPYRIIEPLGAGGMGDVWLAEQTEPIRRRVALKLIQKRLLGGLAEAYFEVERQALARMDHPAIAKVFDAGRTVDGYPYFAMERVEGRALDRWCTETEPDLTTRLRLMIDLARGVQHAHQRGIVHRDIKPSNVLVATVDGRPQPKIIDFGIAIGLGDAQTDSGPSSYSVAGTAMFMSPEQAEGRSEAVDTRSDVYALGMILLGLLLPPPGLASLARSARAQDAASADPRVLEGAEDREPRPAFPSASELHGWILDSLGRNRALAPGATMLRGIPWELRHLLRVALAPARADRLESAEHLAQELESFLAQRSLASVPPTLRYRSGRFLRRHRLAFAAGALVVASLLVGLGAALHGMWRAEQEAQRSRAMADFMADVLTGVDPDRARDLDRSLLNLILDEAASAARNRDDLHPEVLVDIEGVIGGTYNSLGDYTRALEFLEQGYRRGQTELGSDHALTLNLGRRYADALSNAAETDQALRIATDALRRAEELHPDRLQLIGTLRDTLAWILREDGRREEALAMARAAAQDLERAGLDASQSHQLLNARYIEAIILSDLERFAESETLLRELIAWRTEVDGAAHPRTLRLLNSLAVTLLQARRYAEAEPVLREALAGSERSFGPDHSATLGTVSNLGGALRQQGKIEESGPFYRRAMEGFSASLGDDHPRAIMTRHNHANYLLDAGDAESALAEQSRSLALGESRWGREHYVSSEILLGIGKALIALGRLDEAQRTLEEALEIKRRLLGESHRTIDNVQVELAKIATLRDAPQSGTPR